METRALVNEETAQRVLAAADELGYRPNPIARGLKTSRSYTVGVLIPDLTNPLFPPIVRGIQDRLEEAGYTPLIANTDNDPDRERADIEAMRARQVDGLITATAHRDDDLLDGARAASSRWSSSTAATSTARGRRSSPTTARASRLAIEHLVALGHRRIAHLAGPQELSTGLSALRGVHRGDAREPGSSPTRELVLVGSAFIESEGERLCNELLDRGLEVTAIVAGNDLMALGCYDAFVERGIDCPDRDLGGRLQRHAVRGWFDPAADDGPPAALRDRRPRCRVAARPAPRPGDEPTQMLLDPELVVRGSTAPPAAG